MPKWVMRRGGPLCLMLLMISNCGWSLPTHTLQVSASVVNGCVISGTNTGVFGTLDFGTQPGVGSTSASASFVQSSTINLACTPGTTLNMSINGGSNYGSSRNLKVANNTNLVAYTLYTNASHSATSAIPVNQNVALTYTNANNITLPIYGVLQLSGVNRAGTYSDTLTVTLSW